MMSNRSAQSFDPSTASSLATTHQESEPPPIPLHLPLGLRIPLIPYLPQHNHISKDIHPPSPSPSIPHLTLTYATSLDAQLSLRPGTQTLLSGPSSKATTHFLRTHHDAILIGVGTASTDDPGLNSRFCSSCLLGDEGCDGMHSAPVGLEKQPVPVILDPRGRWLCRGRDRVVRLARAGYGRPPLWVVDVVYEARLDEGRRAALREVGGTVVGVAGLASYGRRKCEDGEGGDVMTVGVNWGRLMRCLGDRGIRSVMVEGGGRVIRDLFREGMRAFVGSVIVTMAPVWLGKGGVEAMPKREKDDGNEVARLTDVKWIPMGNDVVLCGRF